MVIWLELRPGPGQTQIFFTNTPIAGTKETVLLPHTITQLVLSPEFQRKSAFSNKQPRQSSKKEDDRTSRTGCKSLLCRGNGAFSIPQMYSQQSLLQGKKPSFLHSAQNGPQMQDLNNSKAIIDQESAQHSTDQTDSCHDDHMGFIPADNATWKEQDQITDLEKHLDTTLGFVVFLGTSKV